MNKCLTCAIFFCFTHNIRQVGNNKSTIVFIFQQKFAALFLQTSPDRSVTNVQPPAAYFALSSGVVTEVKMTTDKEMCVLFKRMGTDACECLNCDSTR